MTEKWILSGTFGGVHRYGLVRGNAVTFFMGGSGDGCIGYLPDTEEDATPLSMFEDAEWSEVEVGDLPTDLQEPASYFLES